MSNAAARKLAPHLPQRKGHSIVMLFSTMDTQSVSSSETLSLSAGIAAQLQERITSPRSRKALIEASLVVQFFVPKVFRLGVCLNNKVTG